MENLDFLNRFKLMLTSEQLTRLLSSRVIVFGVGGVGGAVCHFLVRSGIQNIDVVDFDTIDVTNINRQLVAYQNNVGKFKVDEIKNQLLSINKNLNINAFNLKYSAETQNKINLNNYDFIIDCIDDINAKKLLIINAKSVNKPIICAMGAGNRYKEVPNFQIADISKTSYDPLAKIIRKFCVENNIKKLNVCYTKQKAVKFDSKIIASVVYYPISMACAICSHVINSILEVNNGSNNK